MSLRTSPVAITLVAFTSLVAVACSGSDSGNDLLSTGAGGTTAAGGGATKGGSAGSVGLGGGGTTGKSGSSGNSFGGSAAGTAGQATGGAAQSAGASGAAGGGPTAGTAGATNGGSAGAPPMGGAGGGSGGTVAGGKGGATGSTGGGAGTSASGAAGTSVGGSAGSAQGGAAQGGSAGTAQGGSAGTAQGGSAGTAQGGTAGAGGSTQATDQIGAPCATNVDCGGGLCLNNKNTDLGAGPANGYCSLDCTTFLVASIADPNTTEPDPCNGTLCLNFGTTASPMGRCALPCEFGAPALTFNVDPNKCAGRNDVACTPLHDEMDNIIRGSLGGGQVPLGYCRPLCTSDAGCAAGDKCDLGSGGCIPTGTTCQTHETLCDPTLVDASGAPLKQCEGFCVAVYGATATPDKQKIGLCMDPCEAGNPAACGGTNGSSAYCGLYNLYGYDGTSTVDVGTGDLAVCGWFGTSGADDNTCAWEAGSFIRTFQTSSGPLPICVVEGECTTSTDCVFTCNGPADCATGDSCVSGQCRLPGGAVDTGGRACVDVAAVGRKYCIDHVPSGLTPKGSPGCVPLTKRYTTLASSSTDLRRASSVGDGCTTISSSARALSVNAATYACTSSRVPTAA